MEQREKHLDQELRALKDKSTAVPASSSAVGSHDHAKDNDEKVFKLEKTMKELEGHNRELKEKLEATTGNVSSFIREMSTLLDSHELYSVLNAGSFGEEESEEEEYYMQ